MCAENNRLRIRDNWSKWMTGLYIAIYSDLKVALSNRAKMYGKQAHATLITTGNVVFGCRCIYCASRSSGVIKAIVADGQIVVRFR